MIQVLGCFFCLFCFLGGRVFLFVCFVFGFSTNSVTILVNALLSKSIACFKKTLAEIEKSI